ncbi:MAG TPA: hypothetical protein VFE16_14065 [Candidatus Cybelea sp.]|jgi:DNA-binding beta-propeller fold protein YncE|nr:hypothetical protein [Candidatus Cybelea sp.]
MRKQSLFLTAATAVVSAALLSACSSGVSQGTSAGLPSTGVSQSRGLSDALRSGVAPKFSGMIRHSHAAKREIRPDQFTNHVIYISDSGNGAADVIKYNHWTIDEGTIGSGMSGANGNWVDRATDGRHLFEANYTGPYINEYNPDGSLAFTYSAGMTDPVEVTTDKHKNVYEGEFNYNTAGIPGAVNEYAPMTNSVMASCAPGNVEGVAVDKHGNVFAAYNNVMTLVGSIIEYPHGLSASGCVGTVLPITFGYLGSIVFDRQGNLVVCDQTGPNFAGAVIDIVAPPYSAVTGTLGSGWLDPFHATVDMAGTRAYVTDLGAGAVDVLDYPAGTLIATIDTSTTTGVLTPTGAVDEHNLVVDNMGP